jgi:hypothetical protein
MKIERLNTLVYIKIKANILEEIHLNTKYRVIHKELYNLLQMLLCGECYENAYT